MTIMRINFILLLCIVIAVCCNSDKYIHNSLTRFRGGMGFQSPLQFGGSSRKQTTTAEDGLFQQKYEERTLQDFATRDSRLGFIRKVYAILGTQLVVTFGIIALVMSNFHRLLFYSPDLSMAISTVSSLGCLGKISYK